MCLAETLAGFTTLTQQAQMQLRSAAAAERVPSAPQLLAAMQQAGEAFAATMELMKEHDGNHLVFQACMRLGGKFVTQFLKVPPPPQNTRCSTLITLAL